MFLNVMAYAYFSELFEPIWAPDHITTQGDHVILNLDSATGCGFMSKNKYLFGKISAQIKLVQGDSAGTVTAYYLTADGPNHDELDFEFLGNVSGEPYLVQTNVFVNGTGDREQRHSLWFDPTTDFHNYTFFWNHHFIIFQVDQVPIRVFEKKEEMGAQFPKTQAMGIHGSLWNGDDWATQGGRVKTNWSHSPFVVTFGSFEVDACAVSSGIDDAVAKCDKPGKFWWDKSSNKKLDKNQRRQLKMVQDKYLVYDYCKDTARFTQMPRECQN
ncbi:xyloglucan endotransglucosylase/hydrolase protein 9-like [Coffea eugenioides]|uniref:xyloglucan endotransglucosylase/hydrolase protein 9-like n=1 Tax=Coffea eugenioides TaxID=49369 RepID=UPI000F60D842|nr:xyloglucan endotransglucosylase/hydrolase protein 9-like [Coffea eugenioides]